MLAYDRHQEIVHLLEIHHSMSVKRLAQQLHVSEPTMRRDLKNMEAGGLIRRTHGGAISLNQNDYTPLAMRMEMEGESKKEVARRAAAMISDGATVFIDASSTARCIASYLRAGQNFTAVTNSLFLCRQLMQLHISTYCLGGRINELDEAIRGPYAEHSLRQFHFDLCFFSCTGLSEEGILSGRLEEGVSFLQAVLRQSEKTVFLCTSSRLNKTCPYVVCSLADIDTVICDAPLPPALNTMVGSQRRR